MRNSMSRWEVRWGRGWGRPRSDGETQVGREWKCAAKTWETPETGWRRKVQTGHCKKLEIEFNYSRKYVLRSSVLFRVYLKLELMTRTLFSSRTLEYSSRMSSTSGNIWQTGAPSSRNSIGLLIRFLLLDICCTSGLIAAGKNVIRFFHHQTSRPGCLNLRPIESSALETLLKIVTGENDTRCFVLYQKETFV